MKFSKGMLLVEVSGKGPYLRFDIKERGETGWPNGGSTEGLHKGTLAIVIDCCVLDVEEGRKVWLKLLTSEGIGWCPEEYWKKL